MNVTENTEQKKKLNKKLLWIIIPALAVYSFVFCQMYLYVETLVTGRGHYVWNPYTTAMLRPDSRYLPGVSVGRNEYKLFSINRLGLRGPDMTGADISILVLGGSTTEEHYLDNSETWPQIMAGKMNESLSGEHVVANNTAKAGLEMRHYYLQAKALLPELKTIDIVVVLPGPNDLIRFLSTPSGEDITYTKKIDRVAFDRTVSAHSPWAPEVRLKTIRQFRDLAKAQTKRLLMKTRLWQPETQGIVRDSNGEFYEEARVRRRDAEKAGGFIELPDEKSERLDTELERYRAALKETVDAVVENGVIPVLLTHPLNYSPDMSEESRRLWWAGALYGNPQVTKGLDYLTERALAELLEKYNQVVRNVAEERGAILVDLAEEFRNDASLFYDQWHLNEKGAREVGEATAQVIIHLVKEN